MAFQDSGDKQFRYPARTVKTDVPSMRAVFNVENTVMLLKTGDIVDEQHELIVNTANMWLENGSGVTGAIFDTMSAMNGQSKYAFEDYSRSIGYCPPGSCVLVPTPQHTYIPGIIHLVGAPYNATRVGALKALYMQAVVQALEIAYNEQSAVAFPSLGTGIYGIPTTLAAEWFFRAVCEFADRHDKPELSIIKVIYDLETWHVYRSIWLDLLLDWQQIGGH